MSAPTVQCPQCFHRLPAPSEPTDKLKCPSCESMFSPEVESPLTNPAVPRARAIPVSGAAPAATPTARPADPTRATPAKRADDRPRRKDDDDTDSRPRSRRRDDDEDDDRPRSRRRSRWDDEDDKPAKKKGGSALPIILIAGGLLGVLTVGGIAAVVAATMWSAPVAKATAPVFTSPPQEQPQPVVEPEWVGPNGPNGPNGAGGLGGGPGGDFQPPIGPGPVAGGGLGGPLPGRPGGGPPVEPWNPQPEKPKVPKQAPKYAEVVPQEIKPAKLGEDTTEVRLPGKIGDTCGGGGGRFFILHLSDKRQLAIFDVTEAKVVKYIALASDSVKFAAGMNKLIVAYPDQNTFTRYDLTTFEKEATVKSPVDGTVRHVCMGSASAGPLLVGTNGQGRRFDGGVTFIDPVTFKELDIEVAGGIPGGDQMHYRAGPDGTVFGAWSSGSSPMGLHTVTVKGGAGRHHSQHDSVGHLKPGPDGTVYTGNGLYSAELKKLDRTRHFFLPAAEGHLYLRINNGDTNPPQFPGLWPGDGHKLTAEVRMPGDERAVFTYKNLGPFASDAWAQHDFTCDKRVHFSPTAGLLVTVPATNDKLVLHKFDLEAAFEASGVDFLYVASRPNTAVPGKGYEYQIAVKSKKGGVKCKLEAGPTGLKVSDAGKVTWATPADFTTPEQVIITISDASGQEIFHTFALAPGDGKGFAGPIDGAVKVNPGGGGAVDPKGGSALVVAPDRVFELKPPPLQEKASIALPGAADAVCAGGGGRFLIYRLGSKKQLAVLDVTVGRVVKYLPLAEGDALFAAGMTKLFVFNKTAGVFLRYDLEKFEKELTAQNPLGGNPSLMLMGHSSEGPLYVGGPDVGTDTKGYGFINTRTMKEQRVPLEGVGNGMGAPRGGPPTGPAVGGDRFGGGGSVGVAVSPDGRTYCWNDGWGGNRVMTIGDKSAKVKGDGFGGGGQNRGALVPGPDGHLFGMQGVYTADMKKVGDNKAISTGTFVPATSGSWYVSVIEGDRWGGGGAVPKRKIHVGLTSDDRIKFPFDSLDGLPAANQDPWSQPQGKPPLAARLHLVPEAEVLAVLDDGMEKVHLHRLPVKTLLAKTDGDYMMVVSRPPSAVRGQKWAYTPEVWSKKGGVKVKVESGPEGMKATGGSVSWDVPAKFTEDDPTVILTVSDASGQETFHTFSLSVRTEGLPTATVIRPTPPAVEPGKAIDPAKVPAKPASAFPLKPTAAKDGTDVELPAAADYACLAGGGRFILFRIPSKKQVAVFDVVDGKVVKELAMPEDGALVAGSRSFAYVINSKAGLVQRWNLNTFEKEATTKLPDGFAPTAAVMGHASEGPLLLGSSGARFGGGGNANNNGFYDPLTLKKLQFKGVEQGGHRSLPEDYRADSIHCSADGRVFAWWSQNVSPSGMSTVVITGDSAKGYYSHTTAGVLMVGADGTIFCGGGVFPVELNRVIDAHTKDVKADQHGILGAPGSSYFPVAGRTALPATEGPWYLWFPASKPGDKVSAPPSLKMLGVKEPLGELKDVRGLSDAGADPSDRPRPRPAQSVDLAAMPFYQRTFLIPGAELLAVLSPDGTRVHIHAFKARELIDKSGQEYLLVMGHPPQFAPPGTKWAYTPEVWSKKGEVKVEVVTGPPGLKAEGAGVAWDVPKDLLDNQVLVELKVSDASGKSVPHAFNLSLTDTAPTPVAAPPGNDPSPPSGTGVPRPGRPRPPVPTPEPPKKDEPLKGGGIDDALVGTWVATKTETGVQSVPSDGNLKHVFAKDGTLRKTVGKQETDWTYSVDVAASPKTLNMVKVSPEDRGLTTRAVYEVSGDTLRICYAIELHGERPTAVKADGKFMILTFERRKEGPKKDEPKPGDRIGKPGVVDDTLVGTWRVEKINYAGSGTTVYKQGPTEPTTRFEFRKDGTSTGGTAAKGHLAAGTFTTDPTRKPKALDLIGTIGERQVTLLAVYEVNGDVLTIYRGMSFDAPRPTELALGEGVELITLSRVKEDPKKDPPVKAEPPKDPKAAPPKPADPGKKDDKDETLVGTWATDKIEVGGRAMPLPPPAAGMRHIFDKDGGVRVTGGPGGDELTGTYKLDTSVTPKAIDMTLKSKSGAEQKHSGVYEVTGDTMIFAMPPVPGGVRPADLKGTQSPVMILKKVKEEAKK